MRWNLFTRAFLLVLILSGVWTQLFSSPQDSSTRELVAVRVQEPPVLDGLLEEEVWGSAPRSEPFKQKEPTEGQSASESTYVRVLYTENSLFLGIVCLDSSPSRVIATELRRDGDLRKDDSIWILIDSFHDQPK